jgi:mono/diheme cytochrome c family protein
MLKNISLIALAAAVAAGVGYASQATATVEIPVANTPATSGKQMYVNYCAPCHGVDGRGNGPVAAALKQQPADLTLLSKNNGGKFPSAHVMAVLEFGASNPAHGTAEMPVWGPVLSSMDKTGSHTDIAALRMSNINHYIEMLQVK